MSRTTARIAAAAMLSLALVMFTAPYVVEAHEHRHVGPYAFVIGWMVEPAFEAEKNGIDFRVTMDEEPVVGLEQSVEVEVTHVETGESRVFALRTVYNAPGRYTADLMPMASGDYRFHVRGTIDGVEIDEEFTSGPNTFSTIESIREIQFPFAVASVREVESVAREAVTSAADATQSASSVQTLAVAGLATGIAGVVFGLAGLGLALRRR